MNAIQSLRSQWLAAGVRFAAASYATYVAVTWYHVDEYRLLAIIFVSK